jgi:hypothetical protein
MATHVYRIQGQDIIALELDSASAYARGRPERPELLFPFYITVNPWVFTDKKNQQALRPICILQTVPKVSFQLPSNPISVECPPIIGPVQSDKKEYYEVLKVCLDASVLDAIEKERGNGDLHVNIDMDMLFSIHESMAKPGPLLAANEFFTPVIGYDNASINIQVDIAQSRWAQTILPQLGYGQIHCLEVRLGKPNQPQWKDAVSKLEEAWAAFRSHNFEEVPRLCYLVFELVREQLTGDKTSSPEKVLTSLEQKLCVCTEQAKKFGMIFDKVQDFTHLTRHAPPSGLKIGYHEAEVVLIMTQLLLSYLSNRCT